MQCADTLLPGVKLLKPQVFEDKRGFFLETWNASRYFELGIATTFVQDNLSFSFKGVLRGLHYQQPNPQAKLVCVLQGSVFDVAVDIRHGSPTFGRWLGVPLSADNKWQLYIPAGFAHGFCVTSDTALFAYKCSSAYSPCDERGVVWNDADLGINWPLAEPTLSDKDKRYPRLKDIPLDKLSKYED